VLVGPTAWSPQSPPPRRYNNQFMFCLLAPTSSNSSQQLDFRCEPPDSHCLPPTDLGLELAHWKSEVSESGGRWLTTWRWQARALPWLVMPRRLRPYRLWASPLDAGQQNALRLMSGLSERLSVLGKTSQPAFQYSTRASSLSPDPRFSKPPSKHPKHPKHPPAPPPPPPPPPRKSWVGRKRGGACTVLKCGLACFAKDREAL
jgi:hypothetical protein